MSAVFLGDARPGAALAIPLFASKIKAGFPSPAQDYVERTLDLNELCIRHPNATFFVRVEGDSMIEAGIYDGDVLVVDRSVDAEQGVGFTVIEHRQMVFVNLRQPLKHAVVHWQQVVLQVQVKQCIQRFFPLQHHDSPPAIRRN